MIWGSFCKQRPCSGQGLATCLTISLLLLGKVATNSPPACVNVINKDGVNVHNCSGRGLFEPHDVLPDTVEILDFSGNMFTELPLITESKLCDSLCPSKNATSHCRHYISFSRNHISKLADRALQDLRCLKTLDLSFNEIKSEIFRSNTFQGGVYYVQRLLLNNNPLGTLPPNVITEPFLPYLREIDLSHCDIDIIDKDAVDDFPDLTILNLSFNKLKEIHADTFKGLEKLEHLDLRENQLTFFPEHIFGDLRNLKVLLLSNNKIQNFHENAFYIETSTNLQFLDLRNNRLTRVPYTAIDKMANLETLDISQNPIREVTRGSIPSSVQNLVLDNMPELRELGPYSLASFPALVSLSINGNKALETIDRKFLGDSVGSLLKVRLENNKLSTLDSEALPCKQLEQLTIGGNPLFCDEGLEWMIKSSCIPDDVKCSGPLQLKGQTIKTLHSDDLVRDYALESATAVIVLFVCLPLFGVCVVFVWRRRRHFPCVKVTLKGQYVTLFTRDMDDDGEQGVAIQLKVNGHKISAVSNGGADDSMPFVRLHKRPDKIPEEPEAEDV